MRKQKRASLQGTHPNRKGKDMKTARSGRYSNQRGAFGN